MSALSIGLSGLLIHQRLITLTGQNISNADTPGYHRQIGELATRIAGTSLGTGVELKGINRVVDRVLEEAILRNSSSAAEQSAKLDRLAQIQAILAPGDGTLHDALVGLFNAAEKLSAMPDDLTQRRVFLYAASNLTDRLNTAATDLSQTRQGISREAELSATTINSLAADIARMNQQIHESAAIGPAPNELIDRRDQAIETLSGLIDVRVVPQSDGQANLFLNGIPVVLGSGAIPVHVEVDSRDRLILLRQGSDQPIDVTGGKLGGLFALQNAELPEIRNQFDVLARGLVDQFDRIQARGIGLEGPLAALHGSRGVSDPGAPLSVANSSAALTQGDLYVTVTNLATGQRTLTRVAIDPATQSLSDVAAALSSVPNLQGIVDPQSGTLHVIARPGFGIDFTGNFSTIPDTQAITGTTSITFDGRYQGTKSGTLHFRVIGSGTVGGTQGLTLEVRNDSGSVVAVRNIGQGYEAGTPLDDILGVKVALAPGTANNGDAFTLLVTADSDSAHLLPSLGMNSFFEGDDASGLRVRADLLANPESLGLALSMHPGDGANLAELISLRDRPVLAGSTQSFQQFFESILGNLGGQVQDVQLRKSALDSLGDQLQAQRQATSGVDPNEELMKLVQYQRSYQIAAHYVSVVNQTLDELIRLIGS